MEKFNEEYFHTKEGNKFQRTFQPKKGVNPNSVEYACRIGTWSSKGGNKFPKYGHSHFLKSAHVWVRDADGNLGCWGISKGICEGEVTLLLSAKNYKGGKDAYKKAVRILKS